MDFGRQYGAVDGVLRFHLLDGEGLGEGDFGLDKEAEMMLIWKNVYFCRVKQDDKAMSKRTLNIIEYTIALVNEFAKRFGLSEKESFRYIDRYQGMKLIEQCYDIMHTLSFADSVDGMASFCRRHGGTL